MSRYELARDERRGLASHVAPTRMADTTKAVHAPLPFPDHFECPRLSSRPVVTRGTAPRSIRAQVSAHMADGQGVILCAQPRIERSGRWPVRGSSSGEPNLHVGRVVEGKLELGDCDRHGGLTESDLTDV